MAVGAVVGLGIATVGPLAGNERPMRLGLPAYGYPGESDLWAEMTRVPPGSVVVLDPADGPGKAIDRTYEEALVGVRAAGGRVYGYVDTAYGRRPAEDMVADARRHVAWYSVVGVFLDQTPGAVEPAIAQVITELRAMGLDVAVNPGQPLIDRAYVELADHVVVFEGNLASYQRLELPHWMRSYPVDKYWHLVYEVPDRAGAEAVLRRAARLRAGLLYVTDGTMPNPWRRLPTYWGEQLAVLTQRAPSAPSG